MRIVIMTAIGWQSPLVSDAVTLLSGAKSILPRLMISSLVFLAASAVCYPIPRTISAPSLSVTTHSSSLDREAEYEKKRKDAGKDIGKLWDLYVWCDALAMGKQGRSCLRAILKEDEDHRGAHEAYGHLEYDGKWFTSQKKLDKYKSSEEERIAKEKGLVRYQSGWAPKDDVPFLEKGLVRGPNGNWVDAEELKKTADGWLKQDLVWVSPDDQEKVKEGLWLCGEDWKSLGEANSYHAELNTMWAIPSGEFVLYSTCDREVAMKALDQMVGVHSDMTKAFGTPQVERVNVVLLRSQGQYNSFAGGSVDMEQTETRGFSTLLYSFFADLWFDRDAGTFYGAGVGYWDASTADGNNWGIHSARHAAAQSLVEARDSSPRALDALKKDGLEKWEAAEFWSEKKFPDWYRYGLCTYSERYFIDQFVKTGGNYYWAREWSVKMLEVKGGMRPIEKIFERKLSVERYDDSTKLLNEYGLVMAFVLDGKCAPVVAAYAAVKDAIAQNDSKGLAKAFSGLQKALIENESALSTFAKI
ncbi:MAG: hypothetical protein ACI8X5_002544 [Planctomycetota bacterium]|jgi:hypothetical protein